MLSNVYAEFEIEGTVYSDFNNIRLVQGFNQHHEFSINVRLDVLGQGSFDIKETKNHIGKPIIIRFTEKDKATEFKGLITNVSIVQSDVYDSTIVLHGYSPTIMLENKPHVRPFLQKNLKKIVTEVTSILSSECNSKIAPKFSSTFKYLSQYRETNFEFLNRLSAEYGEWFFYDGKELFFGKPGTQEEIKITAGEDVSSLKFNLKIVPTVSETASFFSMKGEQFEATTKSKADGYGVLGPSLVSESEKFFDDSRCVPLRPRPHEQGDMATFTKVQAQASAASMQEVTGVSINPNVQVGSIATIKCSLRNGVDFTIDEVGKFMITNVEHTYANGRYHNSFTGLSSDIDVVPVNNIKHPVAEPQVGIVTSNQDPEGNGRVKVKLAWHGEDSTDWIRVLTPDGGGTSGNRNRGFVFIPEVDDRVMVGFRHNDPDRPFVMGSFLDGKAAEGGGKDNSIKTLKTAKGNIITMNDEQGSVSVADSKGNTIIIDGEGNMTMDASEKIELKCGSSSITLLRDGTITVDGKMKVEVKSTAISMDAKGSIAAKANTNIALEGSASAKLSSSGITELVGSMVKIN